MDFDFSPFFKRYEAISALADQMFDKVKGQHPDAVKCGIGCADCCHALFDLTLIEALYINHHFNYAFDGEEKNRLMEKANKADRRIYQIKRKAFQDVVDGRDEADVLEDLAKERERCALLDDKDLCALYDNRPITCRLYGIPTAINGKGHTCGRSGFIEGRSYPTVNLDHIQKMLYELSAELVAALKSRHVKMGELLVPLSMALLTQYNEEYLGVGENPNAKTGDAQKNSDEAKGDG